MSKPSRADIALEALAVACFGLGLLAGVAIELAMLPVLFAAKGCRALARRLRAYRAADAARRDAWLRRD